jgi:hypothetical protein
MEADMPKIPDDASLKERFELLGEVVADALDRLESAVQYLDTAKLALANKEDLLDEPESEEGEGQAEQAFNVAVNLSVMAVQEIHDASDAILELFGELEEGE